MTKLLVPWRRKANDWVLLQNETNGINTGIERSVQNEILNIAFNPATND